MNELEINNVSPDTFEKEKSLFNKLAQISMYHEKRQQIVEYNRWIDHYDEELQIMYSQCIPDSINIKYSKFVKLAYNCSNSVFDITQGRSLRPLI